MARIAAKKSLDIFAVLRRIDVGDKTYYSRASDAERKELDEFLSFPALKWVSATKMDAEAEYYLEAVADLANEGYFALGKHPELQFKLLCACGSGRKTMHAWVPPLARKRSDMVRSVVLTAHPLYSDEEVEQWITLNGMAGVVSLARSVGVEPDALKKLEKELDKDDHDED